MKINQPLVDSHLEGIPSVGTLSAGRLTGSDPELLGGHTDGSGNLKLLGDSSALEVGAYLLDVLDVARSEGDTDAVDYGGSSLLSSYFLLGSVSRHGFLGL